MIWLNQKTVGHRNGLTRQSPKIVQRKAEESLDTMEKRK